MYDMLMGEEDASPNWDPEMNWYSVFSFQFSTTVFKQQFQPDFNDIRFQLFCLPRYGPMGIGYAPNKELYTEHFLKPLRAAFSDRDLQVCKDKYGLTICV